MDRPSAGPERALRAASRRKLADDWALALLSEGLAPSVRGRGGRFVVSVPEAQAERGLAILDTFERENLPGPAPEPPPPARPGLGATLAVCFFLLCAYLVSGPRAPQAPWFAAGSADAARLLGGEPWRAVTALTLHADATHLAGNLLAGGLFFHAVARQLGAGLGFLLVLVAGAGGNVLNAWVHGAHHDSVGASTAVFAAVGLLAALALRRRQRSGLRGRRMLAPVAAGLALLAMLGVSGERVDVWAHLFGLAAGGSLGLLAAFRLQTLPGPPLQAALGAAAAAGIAGAWALALT